MSTMTADPSVRCRCRECDEPLDPREHDTVALAGSSLVVCPDCWCWTSFDDLGSR